jgi:acetylornithine deacetylase/succinyl-diaminopimelate desuccinylase-like protein
MIDEILVAALANKDAYLKDLIELCAIPSVSAQPDRARDVRYCSLWLSEHLRDIGLKADAMETAGNPVVYAEWKHPDRTRPTVLIYGHYDVQPADQNEGWTSEAFKPAIRDGFLYARGASDNKGQFLAHVKAVQTWLLAKGSLPVSVKFLIEGEEEIGGPHLGSFIAAHRDLLGCDVAVISDSELMSLSQPVITHGLRGLTYFEVEARTAARDLHSGSYGGNVQNPIMALAQLLAGLKDGHGRVLVPDFYADVRTLAAAERDDIARLGWGEAHVISETGAPAAFGEPEFSVAERRGARPTLEINGIWGGYIGPGSKTVLPAVATAKISCRLVPNQDPQKTFDLVRNELLRRCPAHTTLTFRTFGMSAGTLIDLDSPEIRAMSKAAEATYGNRPLFALEGGSLPVVNDLQKHLGKPIAMLGFGLPNDNIHAPNERYALECYDKGIEASIRFLGAL